MKEKKNKYLERNPLASRLTNVPHMRHEKLEQTSRKGVHQSSNQSLGWCTLSRLLMKKKLLKTKESLPNSALHEAAGILADDVLKGLGKPPE